MTAHAFAQLCRGTISGESIIDMEMQILFALGWNVHPPVPMSFVELILDLITLTSTAIDEEPRHSSDVSDEDSVLGDLILPSLSNASHSDHSATQECSMTAVQESILDLVRYQVDLALEKIEFIHIRSSLISVAAVLNAIEGIISDNDAQIMPFCKDSVRIIAKLMSYSKLCSKRELDEVRAILLCSVMTETDGSLESSILLQSSLNKDAQATKVISYAEQCSKSPTATSSYWNQYSSYFSPKSVLSRVCAMHCQCNQNGSSQD